MKPVLSRNEEMSIARSCSVPSTIGSLQLFPLRLISAILSIRHNFLHARRAKLRQRSGSAQPQSESTCACRQGSAETVVERAASRYRTTTLSFPEGDPGFAQIVRG